MAGKGGYQKPNNPATFSGPGKFSQRTDGGPGDMRQPQRDIPSAGYGEGVETAAIQAGAPLSATGGAGGMQPQPIPFSAPTQRPDEPITAGMDFGPGPGSEMLPVPPQRPTISLADKFSKASSVEWIIDTSKFFKNHPPLSDCIKLSPEGNHFQSFLKIIGNDDNSLI